MNSYLDKLAQVIVNYSVGIKPGMLTMIKGETVAIPLLKALLHATLKAGAHPYIAMDEIDFHEIYLNEASEAQLKFISPIRLYEVDRIDAMISVWGTTNTKYLSGIDPSRQQISARAGRPIMDKLFSRTADGSFHWCGTQYPTNAHAQDAGMSLADYEAFVFRAGHLHDDNPLAFWKKMAREQDRLVAGLNQVERLRIRADGTDLTLGVAGRKWINCCGQQNFPDGEIFTSPIENDVNGTVRFSYPAFYHGREAEGVVLTFKDGVVTEAGAERNEDYLLSMLDTDEGSRRLGEVAVGTNYEITKFTRNTLFDEKIGGTCHLALGAGFGESGGTNKSGIHWDMVCNLKDGGEIEADGQVIYKDGRFTI